MKHFLKQFPQITHVSLDIAEDLHPDCVGSVIDMPFNDKQFELTVCCQVLEHLPFEEFLPALREIRRVTKYKTIISLPDVRRRFGLAICFFRYGWFKWELNFTRRQLGYKTFDGQHYWEVGYKGTTARDVINKIRQSGFKIERQY